MSEPVQETPTASRRGRALARTTAWLALLMLVVTVFGFVATRSEAAPLPGPPRGDAMAAQRAIDALLSPGLSPDALALLPEDFTQVTGVAPGARPARDGTVRAVHVDGGCSTPWGEDNTQWDFGTPCRAHDLGYDLLRYAEKKGLPLGPDVRKALDDRLTVDMHHTCRLNSMGSRTSCEAVASLYSAGLVMNSWHQRWGPPVGEPIVPVLAGVAAIGFLLSFRLRGWLRMGQARPRSRPGTSTGPSSTTTGTVASVHGRRWTLVGVGSITLLVLTEAMVALAGWVGVGSVTLWPFTWLAQLAFVFFFAGGRANAVGWLAVSRAGGGYREYLAHRAGWLLRLALVFPVVAFAVPTALEVLGAPRGTIETVVRIALHPLWLLGVYVLTVVATPAMLAAHRRAPLVVPLVLTALLLLAEWSAVRLGSPVPHHIGALVLALLAQQLAFAYYRGHRPRPWLLWSVLLGGGAVLAIGAGTGAVPLVLLGTPGAAPVLAGPALPVLVLGLVQLGVLGLLRGPLGRLAAQPLARRISGLASHAPMSLYLVFLAVMLVVVASVYLPDRLGADPVWLLRPRSLLAIAMLAGPAAVVFLRFERHLGHRGYRPVPPAVRHPAPAGLDRALARAATAAGVGYATIGVFGLALTSFGGAEVTALPGLAEDPVQSIVHLLLGMSLLHSVRTGASNAPHTWLLTALACVPPLLSGLAAPVPDSVGVIVHVTTGVIALAAGLLTALAAPRRRLAVAAE